MEYVLQRWDHGNILYMYVYTFQVKIEKMRSNLEEKLMKRTAIVNRKAEELRAAAELQHSEQMRRLSVEEAKKTTSTNGQNSYFSGHNKSCGCFPRSK